FLLIPFLPGFCTVCSPGPRSLPVALPICARGPHRLRPHRLPYEIDLPLGELGEARGRGAERHLRDALPLRPPEVREDDDPGARRDRKSTRLNSSHVKISYADLCLKKKRYM